MSKEAIRLALGTLEAIANHGDIAAIATPDGVIFLETAITALREALADQPAQPATYTCGVCGVSMQMEQPAQQDIPKIGCVNHDCDKCKAQQQSAERWEPVAWMYQCSADSSGPVLMQHKRDWAESGSGLWTETPLYTSPPTSKPLTDEEIEPLWDHGMYVHCSGITALRAITRAIEAKLREKNA